MMKESGCDALKLEGGREIADTVKAIVDAGIPVMGHLGLTPQSVHKFGGYGVRARGEAEAMKLLDDATCLEEAGCFSIVLEKDTRCPGRRGYKQGVRADNRHRCRLASRRAGACGGRHAGKEQRIRPEVPATLCRFA